MKKILKYTLPAFVIIAGLLTPPGSCRAQTPYYVTVCAGGNCTNVSIIASDNGTVTFDVVNGYRRATFHGLGGVGGSAIEIITGTDAKTSTVNTVFFNTGTQTPSGSSTTVFTLGGSGGSGLFNLMSNGVLQAQGVSNLNVIAGQNMAGISLSQNGTIGSLTINAGVQGLNYTNGSALFANGVGPGFVLVASSNGVSTVSPEVPFAATFDQPVTFNGGVTYNAVLTNNTVVNDITYVELGTVTNQPSSGIITTYQSQAIPIQDTTNIVQTFGAWSGYNAPFYWDNPGDVLIGPHSFDSYTGAWSLYSWVGFTGSPQQVLVQTGLLAQATPTGLALYGAPTVNGVPIGTGSGNGGVSNVTGDAFISVGSPTGPTVALSANGSALSNAFVNWSSASNNFATLGQLAGIPVGNSVPYLASNNTYAAGTTQTLDAVTANTGTIARGAIDGWTTNKSGFAVIVLRGTDGGDTYNVDGSQVWLINSNDTAGANTTNTFTYAAGNGGGLTNLNASNVTQGSLPAAQLPSFGITVTTGTGSSFVNGLLSNQSAAVVLTNGWTPSLWVSGAATISNNATITGTFTALGNATISPNGVLYVGTLNATNLITGSTTGNVAAVNSAVGNVTLAFNGGTASTSGNTIYLTPPAPATNSSFACVGYGGLILSNSTAVRTVDRMRVVMGFNGTNDFLQFMRPVDPHWKAGGAQKIVLNLVSSNTVGAVTACVQVVSLGASTNWPPSAANWGVAAITNIPITCNSVIGNLQTSGLISVNTFSNVTANQELAIRVSAGQASTNFEFESLEVEYDTQ